MHIEAVMNFQCVHNFSIAFTWLIKSILMQVGLFIKVNEAGLSSGIMTISCYKTAISIMLSISS